MMLLYVCFGVFLLWIISNKKDFHIDEIYSYGLSNNVGSIEMEFEQGVVYEPAEKPYYSYLCAETGQRFEYVSVFSNQKADVHPPLYYILLHTICSFFPDEFLLWNAGIINVVFALLTLYFVRKIVILLTSNEMMGNAASLLFCLTPGILYNVAFLRMYVMAMFLVTWLSYLVVNQVNKNDKYFYTKAAMAAMAGALTHYYCIVYCVFISTSYGFYLLHKKQYKKLIKFGAAMVIAAGASLIIFPSMLRHMFAEKRGAESIENLAEVSLSIYINRLRDFFEIVSREVFGGWLLVIMLIVIGVLLFEMIQNKKLKKGEMPASSRSVAWNYVILLIPIVLYFLLVAKMAVYIANRYMFPIYAVAFATFVGLFFGTVDGLFKKKNKGVVICWLVGILLAVCGWIKINLSQMYFVVPAIQNVAKEFTDTDCIYVYDDVRWKTMSSLVEVPLYRSVTFVAEDNMEVLFDVNLQDIHELIVLVLGENDEVVLANVMQRFNQLTNYEQIGEYGYSRTYHMY